MRRIALLVVCALIVSCAGRENPASPTPPIASSNLPLRPGPQLLTLTGFGLSGDPLYPACLPFGVPKAGTLVDTRVMLQRDGGYWLARSTTPELGDLELRFRESGPGGLHVTGTIRGTGVDAGAPPIGIAYDVRVSLAGGSGGATAVVEGDLASPISAMVNGRVTGLARFSDSDGNASTCSAITWSLQPERQS